jgi:enoyl-CoA hydratase/carnithine racemase
MNRSYSSLFAPKKYRDDGDHNSQLTTYWIDNPQKQKIRKKIMPSTIYNLNGITVERDSEYGIFTVVLNRGENRFNPALCQDLSDAITVLEKAENPKALIITGRGKFFSNGLDIDWMSNNVKDTGLMIQDVWTLLARILVMDCRTVAAINGHAFGAGLFLALACDYRVMRTKRGYVNFPEVNLGMRLAKVSLVCFGLIFNYEVFVHCSGNNLFLHFLLSQGFSELVKAKCTPVTLREGVLTAKRYCSSEAIAAGVVDYECPIEILQATAEKVAKAGLPGVLKFVNFNPRTFSQIKIELYTDAYRALTLGLADSPSHSRL